MLGFGKKSEPLITREELDAWAEDRQTMYAQLDPGPEYAEDEIPHDSRDFSIRSYSSTGNTFYISYDYGMEKK